MVMLSLPVRAKEVKLFYFRNRCSVAHLRLFKKGFAWAKVQLCSISVAREALALPFSKVGFTLKKSKKEKEMLD
jgi:hypothetical protein